MAREQQDSLVICEEILHQVVMDYFADVYRLKEFHKIENTNMAKILAYEAYWILRRKPIQMNCVSDAAKNIFADVLINSVWKQCFILLKPVKLLYNFF